MYHAKKSWMQPKNKTYIFIGVLEGGGKFWGIQPSAQSQKKMHKKLQ